MQRAQCSLLRCRFVRALAPHPKWAFLFYHFILGTIIVTERICLTLNAFDNKIFGAIAYFSGVLWADICLQSVIVNDIVIYSRQKIAHSKITSLSDQTCTYKNGIVLSGVIKVISSSPFHFNAQCILIFGSWPAKFSWLVYHAKYFFSWNSIVVHNQNVPICHSFEQLQFSLYIFFLLCAIKARTMHFPVCVIKLSSSKLIPQSLTFQFCWQTWNEIKKIKISRLSNAERNAFSAFLMTNDILLFGRCTRKTQTLKMCDDISQKKLTAVEVGWGVLYNDFVLPGVTENDNEQFSNDDGIKSNRTK